MQRLRPYFPLSHLARNRNFAFWRLALHVVQTSNRRSGLLPRQEPPYRHRGTTSEPAGSKQRLPFTLISSTRLGEGPVFIKVARMFTLVAPRVLQFSSV